MKKKIIIYNIIIVLVITFLLIIGNQFTKKDYDVMQGISTTTNNGMSYSTITQTNDVLLNPGKGWVLYDRNNNKQYEDIVSVGYMRYSWVTIEPKEGEYNWKMIDDAIKSYKEAGKKFAFGVMCANTSYDTTYITPKWVFDAGAQGEEKQIDGLKNKQIIPIWTDEIFLEKLNNFIKELANRYDGNTDIAYIDIRSYGNWGEQHLGGIGGVDITADQLKELYIQPYKENFKETLLINPWGKKIYNEIYEWSIDNGISIRRDGILKQSDGTECFMSYGKLPSIFEYVRSYAGLKELGLWGKEKLLSCVENGKPSYMQIYPDMYDENKEFCDMLANKMGYYFKFKEAKFPENLIIGQTNDINVNFINEGIAPLYEECTVYLGLLDKNYNLVKKYKTDIDPHTWMPNEEKTENIQLLLDDIQTGEYVIALGLYLNEEDEKPTYLLGNTGKTEDKWYAFGEVSIQEQGEVYSIQAENEENIINSNNAYNINIMAENISASKKYSLEVYLNNNLIENIEIPNNISTFNKNITIDLPEGNNQYKLLIKENEEIVSSYEKEIYVVTFEENKLEISNTIIEKYQMFQQEFQQEILKIDGLNNKIEELEKYMKTISNMSEISQTSAISTMKNHYNLGNIFLQAYKDKVINIEYSKLNTILNAIDSIGKSFEDLIILSANTDSAEIEKTKQEIQKVEDVINNNQDIEMTYANQFIRSAKYYNEEAYKINALAENKIKNSLIVSKDLHSILLSNWSNMFTEIYIDKYIENNPVIVEYSETNITNKDVTASIHCNTNIEVNNNNSSKEYIFTQNGEFTFEYIIKGRQFNIQASVKNIDKTPPEINGIENGKVYEDKVKPEIIDENIKEVKLFSDGQLIQDYEINTEIKEEGIYELIAIDKAENQTIVHFQIIENKEDSYKIENEQIKNISKTTLVTEFIKKLNIKEEYKIYREDNILKENDKVCTGDILKTQSRKEYTLIVAGDINKDGDIGIHDIVLMRKYLLQKNNLDDIQKVAADANVDGKEITIKDLVRIRILALSI